MKKLSIMALLIAMIFAISCEKAKYEPTNNHVTVHYVIHQAHQSDTTALALFGIHCSELEAIQSTQNGENIIALTGCGGVYYRIRSPHTLEVLDLVLIKLEPHE